jgi:hypothetical protein
MILVGAIFPFEARAADEAAGVAFFEAKIRPVLIERCYECHSSQVKKPKAGLRLDTRAGIRSGGGSGPAVVPGDLEASVLFQAIRGSDGFEPMPPKGGKLPPAVIADFSRWIKMGAPDPRVAAAGKGPIAGSASAAGSDWWSLRPLRRPPTPRVDSAQEK